MSRGKCKFKTMSLVNHMQEKSYNEDIEQKEIDWGKIRDPFAGAPDSDTGVMVDFRTPSGKIVKRRISYMDRFRYPNDVYFRDMKANSGDAMEQEYGDVYVTPEEAFGRDPIIEDYSKEMDSGDILNKAFDDED